MNVYVDLRCFQDDRFRFRGVGYHSRVLMQSAKDYLPSDTEIIGITDPTLDDLSEDFLPLVDRIQPYFLHSRVQEPAGFIQLSPMTHDPSPTARILANDCIFKVSIVYDFIPLDVPNRYLASAKAQEEYAIQMAWLNRYDHYFPISDYSSQRLQSLIPVPSTSVSVTGVALRPAFEKVFKNLEEAECVPQQGSGKDPYVFCVAGGDDRKNVGLLLKAHATIHHRFPNLKLIIVGCYGENKIAELESLYCKFGGSLSRLKIIKGIDDETLCSLYKNAVVSVACSEIEGFSLPVLESIACGCPILISDNDAHLELVSNPKFAFGVHDHLRLAELIASFMEDRSLRLSTLAEQSDVPHRFTSAAVCERFWIPICEGLRRTKRIASQRQRSTKANHAIPRIAVFSPFPDDASGVADYTRRTIQSLGRIADVDVYTDAVNPTPTAEVRNFFPISELPFVSGQYDQTLTIVGNSHFHIKIINLQKTFGGPCLIHDNRLAELYNWWKGREYLAAMATKHLGRNVKESEVDHWMGNPGDLPSMFFCELVETASPLIVHSRGIQAQCVKEHGVEPEYLPFCCYRDFDIKDLLPSGKMSAREKLGISKDELVIISLGIVGPTKGPFQCIEAISRLKKSGLDPHFYFVGGAGNLENALRGHAKNLGISDNIHFCGDWVSEEDYYRYVTAADMAVQLRNHFFGGLSGAMLDCIGSGLTTIANDDLACALESPESVIRISDSLSAVELADAIDQAYKSKSYLDRLSPSRTRYLEEHSFDTYAIQLLEVLGLSGGNKLQPSKLSIRRQSQLQESVT